VRGNKKLPNLNACSISNNWDELEFIPNGIGQSWGLGHSDPLIVALSCDETQLPWLVVDDSYFVF
jgi:hypothetical protein